VQALKRDSIPMLILRASLRSPATVQKRHQREQQRRNHPQVVIDHAQLLIGVIHVAKKPPTREEIGFEPQAFSSGYSAAPQFTPWVLPCASKAMLPSLAPGNPSHDGKIQERKRRGHQLSGGELHIGAVENHHQCVD